MSLQPILLIGLVLAALLYTGAALIFLRKGMMTIWRWSALMGVVLLGLPLIGFLGVFFGDQWPMATIAVIGGLSHELRNEIVEELMLI